VRFGNNAILVTGCIKKENESYPSTPYSVVIDCSTNPPREVKGPRPHLTRDVNSVVTLLNGDVAFFGGDHEGKCRNSYEVGDMTKANLHERRYVIGCMCRPRRKAAVVLLESGLVLITGGCDGEKVVNCCELFDSETNRCRPCKAKMKIERCRHTASLLPNGNVLICGGFDDRHHNLQTTEIYNPVTKSFSDGPLMCISRSSHTATTLLDGKILVAGGTNLMSMPFSQTLSTELYDPVTNSFSPAANMIYYRSSHFASIMPDGNVFIGGGVSRLLGMGTEIYDTARNTFVPSIYLKDRAYSSTATPFYYNGK
jgi:hypothetical protein